VSTRKRKRANVFANRTAEVSVQRNGLSISIGSVPATDAGVVAKELLDMLRTLERAGYEELVIDAGGAHGSAYEVPDEEDVEDFVLPVEARRRRIGFTS
jgi:diaminopimelate decarboxylase